MAALGDRRWRDLLAGYYGTVRRELARFRGREVDTAGDGFFAAFDGPAYTCRTVVNPTLLTVPVVVPVGRLARAEYRYHV